jgi:type I restriction enzyme R subunit
VRDKQVLRATLAAALADLTAYCQAHGVEPATVPRLNGFALTGALTRAVNTLVATDALCQGYLTRAVAVRRLYQAILPDTEAAAFADLVRLFIELALQIAVLTDSIDISLQIPLDEETTPTGYLIREGEGSSHLPGTDPYHVDFAILAAQFGAGQPHIATQRLRGTIQRQLASLLRLNRTRAGYLTRFQDLIHTYNAGAQAVDWLFVQLSILKADLDQEARRAPTEHLSEEELALFDLLIHPAHTLAADRASVKQVAQDLLATLKREMLVRDWRKDPQTRANVRLAIETALAQLPTAYDKDLYAQKCAAVYEHIYEAYAGPDRSLYTA